MEERPARLKKGARAERLKARKRQSHVSVRLKRDFVYNLKEPIDSALFLCVLLQLLHNLLELHPVS